MSIYFVWMKDLNNNKTIVVRLMGGLGNQLFQLQFAIEMKKKYGATSIIVGRGHPRRGRYIPRESQGTEP